MIFILKGAIGLCSLLSMLIVLQVVFNWLVVLNVVSLKSPFVQSIYDAFEMLLGPIYRQIHRVIPPVGGIDFTPLVLWFLVDFIRGSLWHLLIQL
ncbi:MAG: YggT family protein [Alphaproteobacteria bacterium]|nr:YggT family protein [Alphaproteobacteria bacterium]